MCAQGGCLLGAQDLTWRLFSTKGVKCGYVSGTAIAAAAAASTLPAGMEWMSRRSGFVLLLATYRQQQQEARGTVARGLKVVVCMQGRYVWVWHTRQGGC